MKTGLLPKQWILLYLFSWIKDTEAANIVLTSNQTSVLVSPSIQGIRTKREIDGTLIENPSPTGISSFADVCVDPRDESLVFALSTSSRRVCSFRLNLPEATLTVINCVGGNIQVSPFTGVSAYESTLIISGGVGGFTVYDYNNAGMINATPRFSNTELPSVVGHPDVVMVDSQLAALSTDFGGSPKFRTMLVSLGGSEPVVERTFGVTNSLEFDLVQGPANFPFVSAVFPGSSATDTVLYSANGAVTVQLTSQETSVRDISSRLSTESGAPLTAITCAVNLQMSWLIIGGLLVESQDVFEIQVFSIAGDAFSPSFVARQTLPRGDRLTSVSSAGPRVVYALADGGANSFVVGSQEMPTGTPPSATQPPGSPTMAPTPMPSDDEPGSTSGTLASSLTASMLVLFAGVLAGLRILSSV